jgi:hypothetical protein
MTESIPLNEMMLDFESLGDNCEFGIVQKHAGAQVLSLLNFGFTPMSSLLRGLETGFTEVSNIDRIRVDVAENKELIVKVLEYDFIYHSAKSEGDIEIETLRKNEQIKLKFLAKKMVSIMTTGEKIFVRKGDHSHTFDQAKTLLDAMSVYGPATLLWVIEADDKHPAGSVEVVAPRLLCGRIDRFASYMDAHSSDFTCWTHLCRNAHALWKLNAGVGSVLRVPDTQYPGINVLEEGVLPSIECDPLPRVLPMDQGATTIVLEGKHHLREPGIQTVCRHEVTTDEVGTVGVRVSGLEAGQPYTFSLWYRTAPGVKLDDAVVILPLAQFVRGRRLNSDIKWDWQRLEVSGIVPEDGIMFPRLDFKGPIGSIFETANWRFEKGLIVNIDERPREGAIYAPLEFKTMDDFSDI